MSKEFDRFELDPNRLDEEWVKQPELFHHAARKLADARADWERAKAARDVERAELDRHVRRDPEDFGVAKVTEGAIENIIITQKTYKRATEELIKAKHAVDILEADVRTLEHRKSALEALVKLRLAEYYAEPVTPKGGKDFVEEADRRAVFGRNKSRST